VRGYSATGPLCCGGDLVTGDCEGIGHDEYKITAEGDLILYSKRYKATVRVPAERVVWLQIPDPLNRPVHWCGRPLGDPAVREHRLANLLRVCCAGRRVMARSVHWTAGQHTAVRLRLSRGELPRDIASAEGVCAHTVRRVRREMLATFAAPPEAPPQAATSTATASGS